MAKKKIFVVEDEEDILELIRYHFSREGYQVVSAMSGDAALKSIPKEMPDVIILDLMLPGLDGLTVCRLLKQDPQTNHIPIVMATAKGEESDIVTGLELGAEDYITKPFSLKVLIARIRTVLRRQQATSITSDTTLHVHDIVIDPERRELLVHGSPVELTYTEFSLLYYLAGQPGRVKTRDQIIDAVRGDDYAVTDRAVDVQIVGLRKKLGDCSDYIQTVRGVGYRFKE